MPKALTLPTIKALSISNLYEKSGAGRSRSLQEMIDEAVAAAKQSVVVAVVGEAQGMAHEASSRTDITCRKANAI